MVYDEARFLSLIFALDALCMLDRDQTNWNQRTHISALASGGDVNKYGTETQKLSGVIQFAE